MKRRNKNNDKYEVEEQNDASEHSFQEESEEKPTKKRNRKSDNNSNKQKQNTKVAKKSSKQTKSKSKDMQQASNHSESHQNIIQFRHGDDVVKDHIIPSFIRRWDGESNEIQITSNELSEMTPMFQAYWSVKRHHMNTIVMVEVGRQFMVIQNDAIRMHEIFKKKLIKFSKFLMVYFWGKETEIAKKQLFHMQIPILIMTQLDDPQFRAKFGMVRREITQILTPALHLGYHDDKPRSRLMMTLYHEENKLSVVILDSQSNHFFVEVAQDDAYLHEVRRVLNKYRPVQLLLINGKKVLAQIAKQICNPYINYIQLHDNSIRALLAMYLLGNPSPFFKQLQEAYNQNNESFSVKGLVIALAMVWQHLESLKLLEKIFFHGIFHDINEVMSQSFCSFDSQVYQNLQIFNVRLGEEQTYGGKGTLMGFLDHCRTHHGRKMLHRWIDQPLLSHSAILQRQQAVKQLLQTPHILILQQKMQAYSRLEKRLGDVYHWIARTQQIGKFIITRGINYQKDYDLRKNPAVVKLTQIMAILKLIKQYESFLKDLSKFNLKSILLKRHTQLTDIEDIHQYTIQQINQLQCLPEIAYVADIITRKVSYDEMTGNLEPMPGQSQIYDEEKKHVERINQQLEEELSKWKEYFSTDKISYVSVRARNEIQVPKTAIAKCQTHKDLIFSSQVAAGIRYVTHETSQLSQELMQHERAIAEAYEPFLQDIVAHFCQQRFLWDRYVQAMATLDVLMSFAQAARVMPHRCLPIFADQGISIKKGFHANLLAVKEDLVPNSVELKESERVLLLTGPNMGGKSTLLKQVCIFAVMAQIGSYIPAESYHSRIYDQIFCRMGASDRILQGKSTFYVQLQETQRILSKATERSLVVIDELGRGTSTFDGMAIAQAILDSLIQKIRCYTFYSTHYTQITQQFKMNDAVRMAMMGHHQNEEKVEFTYQLQNGVAEKSFACNVGRMVGIPEQVLKKAEARSEKMHNEIHHKKLIREACKMAGIFLHPNNSH